MTVNVGDMHRGSINIVNTQGKGISPVRATHGIAMSPSNGKSATARQSLAGATLGVNSSNLLGSGSAKRSQKATIAETRQSITSHRSSVSTGSASAQKSPNHPLSSSQLGKARSQRATSASGQINDPQFL